MPRTSPRFEVRPDGAPNGPAVVVVGDLTLSSADGLSASIDEALAGRAGATVDLDLSRVGFIDSSGLKALLDARARCADADRTLVLVSPSEPVVRLLSMVDLLRTFEVRGGREQSA